jgi:hypothetical protein
MVAEFAIELLAVLPDGPQMLSWLPLVRCGLVVGCVEGLVALVALSCTVHPS